MRIGDREIPKWINLTEVEVSLNDFADSSDYESAKYARKSLCRIVGNLAMKVWDLEEQLRERGVLE